MTRFKELRRIEGAIKNKDKEELVWGRGYCKMRIETANKMGMSQKAAARHTRHWENILQKVEEALDGIA